jgi:EPTP domain
MRTIVKRLNCCLCIFFLFVFVASIASAEDLFSEHQLIPTKGAHDFEYFEIDGEKYLAVANQRSALRDFDTDSVIYKWNGSQFQEFQSIPTKGASDWEAFKVDGVPYIVVANFRSGGDHYQDSKIYKWDGTGFVEFQTIPTAGAYDWEAFTIDGIVYLAVANRIPFYSNTSRIYRWNGVNFEEFQQVSTINPFDWEFFEIGSKKFLAVAEGNQGTNYNTDTYVYTWNGSNFILHQRIPSLFANDVDVFAIDGIFYMAIAISGDGHTYNQNSEIYKWNGNEFEGYQSLPTIGAWGLDFRDTGEKQYLAVAGVRDDSNWTIDSYVYEWNGVLFEQAQAIQTSGARDTEFYEISNTLYLAFANMNSSESNWQIDSKIFRAELTNPPVANAGDNISIASEEQYLTIIQGLATDVDNDDLTYRWLDGANVISDWENVGAAGEAELNLSTVPYFTIGQHIFTLEVSDGQAISSDEMIITVDNSAPHAAPTGAGVYEVWSDIILGGQVSDFDGDFLAYEWFEGAELLFSGNLSTIFGGDPVVLPEYTINNLELGTHTLTLNVNDGVNDSVTAIIIVDIVDTTVPTLAPVPNKTILWPPNHKMIDVVIEANAKDNSGDVLLSVNIESNEPQDGLDDEDVSPDWTDPEIDQDTGLINFQLRSERSGSGDGRIYTVTITATDDTGNSSDAVLEIIVPHDKRKK